MLALLAARARLPMQAALQTVYVGLAAYGFWRWSSTNSATAAVISRYPLRWHLLPVSLVILAGVVIGPAVAQYTTAAWPRLDAVVMLASLLATWLTAESKIESWIYWFVVNLASLFLFAAAGLYLVALLYAIYFVIAMFGLAAWRRRLT